MDDLRCELPTHFAPQSDPARPQLDPSWKKLTRHGPTAPEKEPLRVRHEEVVQLRSQEPDRDRPRGITPNGRGPYVFPASLHFSVAFVSFSHCLLLLTPYKQPRQTTPPPTRAPSSSWQPRSRPTTSTRTPSTTTRATATSSPSRPRVPSPQTPRTTPSSPTRASTAPSSTRTSRTSTRPT